MATQNAITSTTVQNTYAGWGITSGLWGGATQVSVPYVQPSYTVLPMGDDLKAWFRPVIKEALMEMFAELLAKDEK